MVECFKDVSITKEGLLRYLTCFYVVLIPLPIFFYMSFDFYKTLAPYHTQSSAKVLPLSFLFLVPISACILLLKGKHRFELTLLDKVNLVSVGWIIISFFLGVFFLNNALCNLELALLYLVPQLFAYFLGKFIFRQIKVQAFTRMLFFAAGMFCLLAEIFWFSTFTIEEVARTRGCLPILHLFSIYQSMIYFPSLLVVVLFLGGALSQTRALFKYVLSAAITIMVLMSAARTPDVVFFFMVLLLIITGKSETEDLLYAGWQVFIGCIFLAVLFAVSGKPPLLLQKLKTTFHSQNKTTLSNDIPSGDLGAVPRASVPRASVPRASVPRASVPRAYDIDQPKPSIAKEKTSSLLYRITGGRWKIWEEFFSYAKGRLNLFIGSGFSLSSRYPRYSFHNQWLDFIAQGGVPYMLSIMVIFIFSIVGGGRKRKLTREKMVFSIVIISQMMLSLNINVNLREPITSVLIWTLLGYYSSMRFIESSTVVISS